MHKRLCLDMVCRVCLWKVPPPHAWDLHNLAASCSLTACMMHITLPRQAGYSHSQVTRIIRPVAPCGTRGCIALPIVDSAASAHRCKQDKVGKARVFQVYFTFVQVHTSDCGLNISSSQARHLATSRLQHARMHECANCLKHAPKAPALDFCMWLNMLESRCQTLQLQQKPLFISDCDHHACARDAQDVNWHAAATLFQVRTMKCI